MFAPYKVVLTNPQSYLCGFVGGLLFMPTTIGDMIWGVPFLGLGCPAMRKPPHDPPWCRSAG